MASGGGAASFICRESVPGAVERELVFRGAAQTSLLTALLCSALTLAQAALELEQHNYRLCDSINQLNIGQMLMLIMPIPVITCAVVSDGPLVITLAFPGAGLRVVI